METAEGKADPDAAAHALRKTAIIPSNKAPNSLTTKQPGGAQANNQKGLSQT